MWKVYLEERLQDLSIQDESLVCCLHFTDGCIALEFVGEEYSGDLEQELLIQCEDIGIQSLDCEQR